MSDITSPGKRLQEILRGIAEESTGPGRNRNQKDNWFKYFGIDHTDHDANADLTDQLVNLRRLFDEVIDILVSVPNINKDLFVAPLFEMRVVATDMSLVPREPEHTFKHLRDDQLVKLDFIADYVGGLGEYNETVIPPALLVEIETEARNLSDQISDSKLNRNLKKILLDIVNDLLNAIHNYKINGAKGIKDSLAKASGAVFVNHGEFKTKEDQDELQKVANLMDLATKAYKAANTVHAIYVGITTVLPALGPSK
jgi:hypothetical protein